MKKNPVSEMRDSYDFSRGVRGKYAKRFAEGTNVVLLDPDRAKSFKSSDEVNLFCASTEHPKAARGA